MSEPLHTVAVPLEADGTAARREMRRLSALAEAALESGYDRHVRTMPKRTAEEILEALDEDGRERTEIERLVYRLRRDQPWLIWSGLPWERPSGWGPDASGFPGGRDRSIVHGDW